MRDTDGEVLWATGPCAGEGGAEAEPLQVRGREVGSIAAGASHRAAADALQAAESLLAERLRSEAEKNALTGEILSKLQELSVLYDVSSELARARDLAGVAHLLLRHATDVLAPDWACVVSHDPEQGQTRLAATSTERDDLPRGWRPVENASMTWRVLNRESPLLVPELEPSDRAALRRDVGPLAESARCLLAVPMGSNGRSVGVVLLLGIQEGATFTSVDAKLLGALASQAAVSAGHLRLYQESKEMFHSTVWALASAIDAKDAYTHGHSQRVARYSAALGRHVGFDDHQVERLELAAILHDIGKIGVPEVILNKEGRLTSAEMSVMRSHPEKGAAILASIRAMRDIVPGVLHHHERYDGLGYPDGLKGESIPLTARIILIADTFDAMTSTRPYRDGLPVRVALEELRRCSDTQFDGRLVEAFVALVEEGRVRVPQVEVRNRPIEEDSQ